MNRHSDFRPWLMLCINLVTSLLSLGLMVVGIVAIYLWMTT
jgi:hypothetical protein